MSNKSYKIPKNTSQIVGEPATAYQRRPATVKISPSNEWNPNVPFHGTQEEWWEHFRRIEEGEFMTIEEADREFEAWKKEYLASRLK
ncbi:MAG: hypothetical protein FWF53_11950 [Candidatus Azobacteroides sp.]|nr:hypothetical protein [Candidatus Azobacteroides sp.]